MALPTNNDDPFDPEDRDDIGSFEGQAGDKRKSTWLQFHGLFGGSVNDGGSFQKHAERMTRFRQSHIASVEIRVDYQKKILLLFPEYKMSLHQFSLN